MALRLRRAIALVVCLCLLAPSWGRTGPAGAAASYRVFVQPAAGLSPVLSLIRGARHTIRLEIYLLTSRSIIDALGSAHARGIDVKVMLEEHPFGGGRYPQHAYTELQQQHVSVRWANEAAFRYTHAKFLEADGRIAGIFTFNLTSSGINRNREFGVIDTNSADARTLAGVFQADWTRNRPHPSDSRLAISPYNSRRDFRTIIDGARRTLDLYAEEVADTSVEAHLAGAVRRGVRVRLITSSASPGVDQLKRSGIAVALMLNPYVHAKAIVADGANLFIGSENISSTSLDRNREVGFVLRNQSLARVVEQRFAADWRANAGSGSPPSGTTSGSLRVQVTATPASVVRGQSLTLAARTQAGAACSVRVTYPDGYVSRARALSGTRIADHAGNVSWSWRVGSSTAGISHVTVTCMLGRLSGTGTASFQIHK